MLYSAISLGIIEWASCVVQLPVSKQEGIKGQFNGEQELT